MISRDIQLPKTVYGKCSDSIYEVKLESYNVKYDYYIDSLGNSRHPEYLYLTKLEAATELLRTVTNQVEEYCKIIDECFKIIKEESPPLDKKSLVYKFMELSHVKQLELMNNYIVFDHNEEPDWTKCFKKIQENGWLWHFKLALENMINES